MRRYTLFYGLTALFFIILLCNPQYDFSLLNTGIQFDARDRSIEDIKDVAGRRDILFAKEGLYGSILVDRDYGTLVNHSYGGIDYELEVNIITFFGDLRRLRINGKTQCGTARTDITTTSLLAGLPPLLGKKGDVLNIGLGCGLTLGVLEKGDFENIDTIEIDPVVIEASREFDDLHGNALDDPRSNMIIDDARNYLLKTDKKYDVIVNEPSHPYTSGCSNLVTEEFFLLMKEHLEEGGMVVQWVPICQLESPDSPGFAMFYRTFSSVFPHNHFFVSKTKIPLVHLYPPGGAEEGVEARYEEIYDYPNAQWVENEGILIGSLEPIDIEEYLDALSDGEGEIIDYFKEIRILDLKDYYEFSNEDVAGFSDEVEIHTDDRPVLEFLVARNLYSSGEQSQCGFEQGIEFKKE